MTGSAREDLGEEKKDLSGSPSPPVRGTEDKDELGKGAMELCWVKVAFGGLKGYIGEGEGALELW